MMDHFNLPLIIAALSILCAGCPGERPQDERAEDFFARLHGTWKLEDRQGFEKWSFNGVNWTALSFSVNGEDTVYTESVNVVVQDDVIIYRVLVYDQNDGLPVDFALTGISGSDAVFENPRHDFPRKIRYRLIDEHNMVVEISGPGEGGSRSIRFSYVRI